MKNTFINKVVAERQVLEIVNRIYTGQKQLAGLSYSAIEAWRDKVSLPADHPLPQSLVNLSKLAQTLSNRSNESFNPVDPNAEPEIRRLIADLPAIVTKARSEG